MALPLGNWSMNFNGVPMPLVISKVDAVGNVTATVDAVAAFGIWEVTSQKLILFCSGMLFVGYFFIDTLNLTGQSGLEFMTLVGQVDNLATGPIQGMTILQPANSQFYTFGWYAQLGVD